MSVATIDWHPTDAKLRSFGITSLIIASVLSGSVYLRGRLLGFELSPDWHGPTIATLGLVALAGGLLSFFAPRLLRPMYAAMSVLTWPIGLIMSEVVLLTIYVFIFAPYGWVMRMAGRDRMRRKFEPTAVSYWESRPPVSAKRYLRQY